MSRFDLGIASLYKLAHILSILHCSARDYLRSHYSTQALFSLILRCFDHISSPAHPFLAIIQFVNNGRDGNPHLCLARAGFERHKVHTPCRNILLQRSRRQNWGRLPYVWFPSKFRMYHWFGWQKDLTTIW